MNNESLVAPFQWFLPLVGTQEPLGLSSGTGTVGTENWPLQW
jgi:hypothetical protein